MENEDGVIVDIPTTEDEILSSSDEEDGIQQLSPDASKVSDTKMKELGLDNDPSSSDQGDFNLHLNLEKLRQLQFNTDIKLECSDGTVHAHDLILIAACRYFEDILCLKSENRPGIIKFDGFSKNVVEIVVNHIYTGKMEVQTNDFTVLLPLIRISKEMKLKKLIAFVWEYVCKNILVNNFKETWATAVDCRLEINSDFQKFIKDNLRNISFLADIGCLNEIHVEELIKYLTNSSQICPTDVYDASDAPMQYSTIGMNGYECFINIILSWAAKKDDSFNSIVFQLFDLVGLKNVSNAFLHCLLKSTLKTFSVSIENKLTKEAIERLMPNN